MDALISYEMTTHIVYASFKCAVILIAIAHYFFRTRSMAEALNALFPPVQVCLYWCSFATWHAFAFVAATTLPNHIICALNPEVCIELFNKGE